MPLDVARARRETPGCSEVIHLNNAGASLLPQPVLDAVLGHLQAEARLGGYEAAEAAAEAVEDFYPAAAAILGASPEEIAYTDSATRAWDQAFHAIRFRPGDRILTSRAEYASNYIAFLQLAERRGVRVEAIPDDETGQISVAALAAAIDDRVRLIALTHVPTQGGLVAPAAEVGRIARQAGVLYLLDACQSFGQLALDVEAIGCDMLSATGRKYMRGPRGTGLLYVRQAVLDQLDPPFLDLLGARWAAADRYELRPDARRFESWERHVAGQIGLAVAMRYAQAIGLPAIEARVSALGEQLRQALGSVRGVTIHDRGARKCGLVSFTVAGREAAEVKQALAAKRINVSVSGVDSSRLDLGARGLTSLVRASVHYYNEARELEALEGAIAAL
ncbi:MAG: aminotransferase class V-fold PLP-dependent enzyme [Candidatus Sericytochromatia bacterium]